MSDVHTSAANDDRQPLALTDSLPGQNPAVASVVVEGSAVLYDERTGRCHVLNPTASLIWSCLGSGGSTEALVADLADAFAVPFDAIVADVLDAVAAFDQNDLLDNGPRHGAPTAMQGVRYLEEARTSCMQKVDGLGWSATVGVELPTGLRLGVRASTAEAAAVVRRALGSLVVDDPACEPNLSLRLEPDGTGPLRSLHTLYRSCSLAVRTRHRERAIDALVQQVWSFVAEERDDAVMVSTTGLERDGRVVLAPPRLRGRIGAVEPRLRRAGIAVIDAPAVELGVGDRLTALLGAPPLPLLEDAGDVPEVAARRESVELPSPPPGVYPVVGRLVVGRVDDRDRSALLAGALADLANIRHIGGTAALAAAVRLSEVPIVVAPSWGAIPLVDAATSLFDNG